MDRETTIEYLDMGLALKDIPEDTKIALLVSAGQSVVRLGEFEKGLGYYEQALAMDPKVFLFDEPMAGLDESGTKMMINLFKKIK